MEKLNCKYCENTCIKNGFHTGNDIKIKLYDYDENGNLTAITQTTGESETVEKLRTNLWDEENRLRAVDITPDAEGVRPIAIYTYDAGGERVLKHSNTSVSIYLNGKKVADTIQTDATIYPSGMLVAKLGNNGSEEEQTLAYTKHYYAGTQRVSSKIGTTENLGDFLQDWITQGLGGPVDAIGSSMDVLENAEDGVVQVYTELGIDPPSYESSPTFIPVESFTHGDDENEIYWFHPDHLGSTSYITNILGEVSQHMEYFAFGETFVEEHRSSNNSPYKFNGKELDEETGWYYYGARYYDPRISTWLSVDPLMERTMQPYQYTYQNPVRYVDTKGMKGDDIIYLNASGQEIHRVVSNEVFEVYRISVGGMAGFAIGVAASTSQTVEEAQAFNEAFAGVLDTPSSMSMSFTGEANVFSGADSQGRDRYMAEGTLSISVGFDNGVNSEIIQEGANSGPYGFGPIPNGNYEATGITNTNESGMVRNGVGFKVFLSDNESLNRNQLRIHPDQTPSTGTAGCIGLTCGANDLREVRGQVQNHFNNNPGTSIPVNVNIANNPNYNRPKDGTQNSGE